MLLGGWASTPAAELATHRSWIAEMKDANRGPFAQIRWFCKDGSVLLPEPYACKEHGGGTQHGEWSQRTLALREAGYWIANFLADLDLDTILEDERIEDALPQLLIEQFLIRADDGWILRKARFYRGAYQEEAERRGARRLLFKMAEDPTWLGYRFIYLRTAARLFPHGQETPSIQEIRELAATLSDRDAGFKSLRNKIHGRFELADAESVDAYAQRSDDAELKAELARLAGLIRGLYAADLASNLTELGQQMAKTGDLPAIIEEALQALAADPSPRNRFATTARLLADLRDRVTLPNSSSLRLKLVDASLSIEGELFTAGSALRDVLPTLTRAEQLAITADSILAQYGVGLISKRQRDALLSELDTAKNLPLNAGTYKQVVDYSALAPTWGTQTLRRFFGVGMEKLAAIEPKANLFIQDQLRASPLFFYATLIDGLARDANRLNGVKNELFGEDVGAGLRSLNPGLARGVLRFAPEDLMEVKPDGIYILPETVSDLPPLRGILTAGEGNPLSHIQLLARNLGIPNVGVAQRVLEKLNPHVGESVNLAVSPAGSVRLEGDHGELQALFADGQTQDKSLIHVDLEKLDLSRRDFIPLSELRASDSGRLVGPKAAKLGELKHHYPDAVTDGIAIPFGAFRELLERPMQGETTSVFEWMQREYRRLAALPAGSAEQRDATEAFRARLQQWVENADQGSTFRTTLREKLTAAFGADGSFGVFVRSDTNVEDLTGFTGAGLNLTLPNVVGFDNILKAISAVWASPFSARSFAWRQSLMDQPEHVYPAVLLMLSVNSEKSGVMVTRDIDTGSDDWLSVAANEGVGGAVDGQSAESLRIDTQNGTVRLLAQATAPYRRQLDPAGGVKQLPTSASDQVLLPDEIAQLVAVARELPQRFPPIADASGNKAPADIEFGFVGGQLRLFQIRPFLESGKARSAAYLQSLDAELATHQAAAVDMNQVPAAK